MLPPRICDESCGLRPSENGRNRLRLDEPDPLGDDSPELRSRGEQLSAPAILTMSPSVFTGVSRGHDIAIIWQGGGACRATFEFDAYQGGSTYTVMCSFPSTDGSGTIPAAALQVFPSGLIVNYTATCDVTSDMAVGPWDISARAFEQARTPSGGPVLGSLGSW